ncbi:putative vegetative incompatibility protein HET-E-1 [Rosellinia necatrix]|uniref:Putative vegetative incompatibility protein HET-E-1 n=1 Tax=Rosellinia necatrix TaxID=77044 RepID=A0A1W2TBH8_ROSNE|nr:putative vegetative incompatibility protein HET-E-1 [Rosellinia necatrix]
MAEAFGVSASALAVAELSAKVVALCFRYSQEVRHAKKDIERVIDEVRNMEKLATDLRALLDTDQRTKLESLGRLKGALSDLQSKLNDLHDKPAPRHTQRVMGRLGIRALKWPFESKDVERILGGFTSCIQLLTTALHIDQTRATHTIENDVLKLALDKLPIAAGATFDSHAEEHNATCLPGTREALLDKISRWASDSNSGAKPVFWLNGMAGTGKSTISRTLARSFHKTSQLGASFFFKRGEGDRGGASKFFTTIATQLIHQNPGLTRYVKMAIDEDNDIAHKSLETQFEKLILTPLSSTSLPGPKVLVLVVDALDECERTEDARQIINILLHANMSTSWRLRIFLTSRPELHVLLGFSRVQGAYEDLILHKIEESVIEQDLAVYFKHQLASIRDDHNQIGSKEDELSLDWPSPSEVKILIEIAMPLFIFAATACRFIGESRLGHPKDQLQKILEHRTKSQESKLDATYLPILNQLLAGFSDSETSKILDLFKHLVGSIVILENPLSASALASLLNISQNNINSHLSWLHSVLSIPSSPHDPIRLFHLSFRDFLLDPSKSGKSPFWVDEKKAHKRLAADCILLLNKTLRKDICNLEWPGTRVEWIDPQTINDALPIEVQYACKYWVYHIKQANNCLSNDDQTHRFLKQHFLHWYEAMVLIDESFAVEGGLQTLQSLCQLPLSYRNSFPMALISYPIVVIIHLYNIIFPHLYLHTSKV